MAVRPDSTQAATTRFPALAKNPLLAQLSTGELARFMAHTTEVEVPAGMVLLREGEESRDMYFLLEGQAELRRNTMLLRAMGPGGHLGALGLLTGRPRSATVAAETRLLLARLSPGSWDDLAAKEPALALKLALAILRHVREELVDMTDSVGALLQGRSLPRAGEVTVTRDGLAQQVRTGTLMRYLLPAEAGGSLVVAGLLGQYPVSLNTPVYAEASIAPLTVKDPEGRQIYARSVGLLLLEAAHQMDPGLRVRLGPSLGATQIVEVAGPSGLDGPALTARLTAAMQEIAASDAPIRREYWTLEEALTLFQEKGWEDAARLLRNRRQETVALVSCGELYALGMGPLLPRTGAIQGFRLSPHEEGLSLELGPRDPRTGTPGASPPPPEDGGMVREHRSWLAGMGVTSVGAFNELCINGQVSELIRVAEGFHEKRIGRIADAIAAARDRLRIICIAGPSSSGKTTFIKRLTVQLQIDGLRPVGISLDDYYVDREKTVRDEKGEYDFEALEALDLDLLHDHIRRLLAGETVVAARYDFKTGQSHPGGGPTIALGRGDVLMLEGIHGLNPRLLGAAAAEGQVYRIFIHPATTLPFDRLTRASATDLRLLRRIIRDRHQRGYSAADNIVRWLSVQQGERKHIFPFQGKAHAVFDSSLIYEPAVLKVFAERYLLEVPAHHPAFATAYRLRHLIDQFVSIYPDHVPPTSIIREFIGGSGFEY